MIIRQLAALASTKLNLYVNGLNIYHTNTQFLAYWWKICITQKKLLKHIRNNLIYFETDNFQSVWLWLVKRTLKLWSIFKPLKVSKRSELSWEIFITQWKLQKPFIQIKFNSFEKLIHFWNLSWKVLRSLYITRMLLKSECILIII